VFLLQPVGGLGLELRPVCDHPLFRRLSVCAVWVSGWVGVALRGGTKKKKDEKDYYPLQRFHATVDIWSVA
jgi:hypothetical protein